jgi:hypothetical protein
MRGPSRSALVCERKAATPRAAQLKHLPLALPPTTQLGLPVLTPSGVVICLAVSRSRMSRIEGDDMSLSFLFAKFPSRDAHASKWGRNITHLHHMIVADMNRLLLEVIDHRINGDSKMPNSP